MKKIYKFDIKMYEKYYGKWYFITKNIFQVLMIISFILTALVIAINLLKFHSLLDYVPTALRLSLAIIIIVGFFPGSVIWLTDKACIYSRTRFLNNMKLNIQFSESCIKYVNDTAGSYRVFGMSSGYMLLTDIPDKEFVITKVGNVKLTPLFIVITGEVYKFYGTEYQKELKKIRIPRMWSHEEHLIARIKEYM